MRRRQAITGRSVKDDILFIGLVAAWGAISGALLAFVPQSRAAPIPPYFWILLAMVALELVLTLRLGGGFRPAVTMRARVIGLGLALGAMLLILYLTGAPVSVL